MKLHKAIEEITLNIDDNEKDIFGTIEFKVNHISDSINITYYLLESSEEFNPDEYIINLLKDTFKNISINKDANAWKF